MAQTKRLVKTLKRALKAQGKTYADVARTLGLSEASVKRLFSEHSFSLPRLDAVCELLDMEISDLVVLMNEDTRQLTELSDEQEREIANDTLLLLVTVCVLNNWSLDDITRHYAIAETDVIRKLARLDRLKMIELQPGNRVKSLIASNFAWRRNGPIQTYFQHRVEAEFFNSRFSKDTEQLLCINGMLTNASNTLFQAKMEKLAHEFDALNSADSGLPLDQRFGTTAVIAIRRWEYAEFAKLRRKDK